MAPRRKRGVIRQRFIRQIEIDAYGFARQAPLTFEELWVWFLCIQAKLGLVGPLGGFLDET